MNITIRKVNIQDVPAVSQLFDLYRIFYHKSSDLEAAQNFIKDRIQSNDSEIIIAENTDGALVGFTQLYPSFSSTRMQRLWVLNDLYVLESFRGLGISKQLIDAAKK